MKNVLLSHRYAAGGNDEIGLLHFVYLPDALGGGLRVVLQHLDNDGLCAQLPQPGSQYIQAGIVYFSGEKGSAGEAQLISGGEQGDTGAARHSPCHNAEGTAFFNSMGRGAAGVCGIADLQIHGSFGGCIADIFASDRIAVQSGPVKGRIIHGGKDVFGEKTACALL